MSYCELNDAFKNMNYKLIETFDGVTSDDIPFKNLDKKNSMRTDYTNSEDIPIVNIEEKNTMGSSYTNTKEENISNDLNGTYLSTLPKKKPTHREFINL